MNINIHKADSRGLADQLAWLRSYHTYSFASYYDPDRLGFGVLKVINDDTVQPSMGFATHSHQNMEIISVPLTGALIHKDNMGNEQIIKAGEVQIMLAGSGVAHSEYNYSNTDKVNFLQIWVEPKQHNIAPNYAQKLFSLSDRHNKCQTILSPTEIDGSLKINQDAYFSLVNIDKGHQVTYSFFNSNNGLYIFMISGSILVAGNRLDERDGAEVSDSQNIDLFAQQQAQILLMEIPLNDQT